MTGRQFHHLVNLLDRFQGLRLGCVSSYGLTKAESRNPKPASQGVIMTGSTMALDRVVLGSGLQL